MSFFESLGNIRADLQMPLVQRQLRSRYDLENQQIEDALNQAMTLKQQQGEEGFTGADKLKYNQLLQRAGINPAQLAQADKYRSEAEIAALQARSLEEAIGQMDSPYAIANAANKLDVSPVRMSGQTAYNRFDTENWEVGTTARGQAEAESAFLDTKKKNIELEVLVDVMKDPNMPFSKKLDYMSGKEISESERVAMTDPETGERVYGTRYWTPSGTKIKKDTDTEGSYVSIPADETTYATQRNIQDLVSAGYDKAEATRIVLGKDRSNLAIYDEMRTNLRKGVGLLPPILDPFELQVATINEYRNGRPGQRLPSGLKDSLKLNNFSKEQMDELNKLIDNVNGIADLVSTNSEIQADAIEDEAEKLVTQTNTPNALQQLPEVPETQPTQQLQTLTPEVMDAAYQAFLKEVPPEAIRQRLEESGFDMSPETVGRMAIDAINQDADPQQVAERFKAMGYDLKALGL